MGNFFSREQAIIEHGLMFSTRLLEDGQVLINVHRWPWTQENPGIQVINESYDAAMQETYEGLVARNWEPVA